MPALGAAQVFGLPSPPAKKAGDYLKAYRSWVFPAIQAIAQSVAAIEIKLYKKKIVRREVVTEEVHEHPALSLLYHVNPFTTQYQLFEMTQTYLELTGEAYWGLVRNGNKITDIWVLRPDWVSIIPDPKEFIKGYKYRPFGTGKAVFLERNEVVPFKTINPTNPYRGYGSVQAAAMAIDINDFTAQWQRAFFYNAAMPSIVFTTDQKIGERELQRFIKAWEIKYQGARKAHQIAAVGGGLKPHILTGNLRDMDFVNMREWMRDEILSMFRVSKANLGIVEDVNRANQEATDARFIKQVVKPKMVSLVTQLNEFLLPMYKNSENLFFDFKDPVPPDQDMDLKYYENGLKYGWLTLNEVRDRENLPPLEGGDVVYLPFNLQPIASVTEKIKGFFGKKKEEEKGVVTLKAKKTKKKVKHNIPIPPKRLRELHEEYETKRIVKGIKTDLIKLLSEVVVKKEDPQAKRAAFWKGLVAQTDVWELQLQGILRALFKEQQQEVLDKVSGVKGVKAATDYLFDLDKANARWLKEILPFLRNVLAERGRRVLQELGIRDELDLRTDPVAEWLEEEGLILKNINEYTKERLVATLGEGITKGEGVTELTERVKEVFAIADTSRAEKIARTETLRAANFATLESYRQSNVVEGKEWVTALDERTCPYCAPMNGKIVALGEQFETGLDLVDSPPVHPNCYDKDTEIYTTAGWRKIKDIRRGDSVLTLNPESRDIEEGTVVATIKERVDKVIRLRNKLGSFDMCVSKNHPYFGYKRVDRGQGGRVVEPVYYDSIDELPKAEFRFYVSSQWKGKERAKIEVGGKTFNTTDFVRFMAYYLSEGSVSKRKRSGYQISIAQTRFLDEMYEEIKGMPFDNVCLGKDKIYIFDQDMAKYLLQFGKASEKYVPKEIKELSPIYLREFLDAYAMGDGTTKVGKKWKGGNFEDSITLFTSSKRMADDLGEVIIKAGKSVSYKLVKCAGKEVEFSNGRYRINNNLWRINILHSRYRHFKHMEVEEKDYNDYVYDVEVDKNHTILLRRNGRVYWGSNCRCTIAPVIRGEMPKRLRPISELRKGHAKLKKMEKKEQELEAKLERLNMAIREKYEELEKEIPEIRRKVVEEERRKAEKEKEVLLEELRDLREEAQRLLEQ